MSNGWIPTTERLPDQREFMEAGMSGSAYAAEFLATIEGADKATTLYYSQTGVWFDEQGEPSAGLWRGCRFRKGIKDNGR